MHTSMHSRWTLAALVTSLILLPPPCFAGGPLLIFDPATRKPYAYPPGTVDVFTDAGAMGPLTKAQADALTAAGFAQWTAVPTSYFAAAIAGDIDLGSGPVDVTDQNAASIVGSFNGGGIHVMYDDTGQLISNFFGAPPGVLGIASPDFAFGGEIVESWVVVNGAAVDPLDVDGASFAGVFTHEFGHAINLAHTQTNGAIAFFGDAIGPGTCPTPYGGTPDPSDVETMYPYIDPSPGAVGTKMATVDVLDDIAAISNVYPTGGWPGTTGTISGTIIDMDGVTPVTGVNVIARNLADPFGDAISALSGDSTQGLLGPDGRYEFHGLTPGAEYAVYIDEIVAGGFSTPPTIVQNEEFRNGTAESTDAAVDDACDVVPITSVAGTTVTADVLLQGLPPDANEPNDSIAQATAIPCPFAAVETNIATFEDVDFYAIDLTAGDRVDIDVDASEIGSTLDSVLGLFSGSGAILALSDDDPAPGEPFSPDSFLHFVAPRTGTFYVAVASYADFDFNGGGDAFTTGSYELHIGCEAPPPATPCIENGDFETCDLQHWTVSAVGSGSFMVDDADGATPLSSQSTVGPAGGKCYAVSDSTGPGTHAISQQFTIIAGTPNVTLSFDMFVNDWSGSGPIVNPAGLDYNAFPNQHARVDLLDPAAPPFDTSGGILATFYLNVDPGAPPNAYTHYDLDITPIVGGGGNFVLRFAEVDNQFYQNQGVDNVVVSGCPVTDAPLGRFMFYKTNASKHGPTFTKFGPVTLADQFGSAEYDVTKPLRLGLPAGSSPAGAFDAITHLEAYSVKGPSVEVDDVRIVNQCGDLFLTVQKPESLLVPTSKSLAALPAAPAEQSHNLDHFLCYKAKVAKRLADGTAVPGFPKGVQVELADQFQHRRYDLTKVTRLCNPVRKSGAPVLKAGPNKGEPFPITQAEIRNPGSHLVCYQAKLATKLIEQSGCGPTDPGNNGVKIDPKQPKHAKRSGIYVNNQFGAGQLDSVKEVDICLPSEKNPVCGNGILEPLSGEQCDDGNLADEDGCSGQCQREVCGDGIVQAGLGEDCEPTDDRACPGECSAGCACFSAVTEDLINCAPNIVDVWQFPVIAGQTVEIRADTVDQQTAADLCFFGNCGGGNQFRGDNEVACSFPPPLFGCPRTTFTADAAGTCTVHVGLCSPVCADPHSARYVLRTSTPAATLIADDIEGL